MEECLHRSALNLNYIQWPAGGDSFGFKKHSIVCKLMKKMIYHLITQLWTQSLVSSLLQYSMLFIL